MGAPPYDAVYGVATHNSYFIERSTFAERGASGTAERILDQLLSERVRALEIDVHFNRHRPGAWSVYHTNNPRNSLCATLADCLEELHTFQYLSPSHDVVNLVIELKELWAHVFDAEHTIAEFDATLRRALGDALYTPRDFLSRCAPGTTLRACARAVGWPSVEALRGKVIVNVLGNFNYNANDWVRYASEGAGVLDRAAFPMRSILDAAGGGCTGLVDEGVHDPFDPGELERARAASIFWQVEELDYLELPRFLDEHGVARSRTAPGFDEQRDRLWRGLQLIQTDDPWHFVAAAALDRAAPVAAEGVYASAPADDSMMFASAHVDAAASDWESAPSTTRPPPSRWSFDWSHLRVRRERLDGTRRARGVGCLRAANPAGSEYVMICRQVQSGELARVTVRARHAGAFGETVKSFDESAYDAPSSPGELVRLSVATQDGVSCARAFSAARIVAGAPAWIARGVECFKSALTEQGLAATRDVLFAGTRHDARPVGAAALPERTPASALFDWSGRALASAPVD